MRNGLRLVIEGRMPEKFLDRALSEGARIRYCERLDERHMLLVTPLRSGRIVEALARRFSIRCERQGCTGVDALMQWLLNRRTLLAGIASLLAVSALLLSRIRAADQRLEERQQRPFSREELAVLFAAMLMEA